MKVKELIEKLQKEDPEMEVLVSRDAEGNGFNSLECVQRHSTDEDFEDVGPYELDEEAKESGYEEEDIYPKKVIVLWP